MKGKSRWTKIELRILKIIFLIITFFCLNYKSFISNIFFLYAEEKESEYVGEFFGIKVPLNNYLFVKSVLQVFGYQGRPPAKNEEELEEQIWEQLLLSFVAFQREVNVTQEEVEKEIDKILTKEKVNFDFRKERESYEKWLREKINEPLILFENQIRHLLQLEKLKEKIMEEAKVEVNEEEARQEFLNEYNMLSVELVEFPNIKEAEEFYNKVKRRAKIWEREKEKRPKDFKRPGFVSLEFLIDIWKFPLDSCYEMLKLKINDFYKPTPIYRGYAVFKILEKRLADEENFAKLKDGYYQQITQRKKLKAYNDWLKNLKEVANIKVYKKEEKGG
ncbi:MAG: hypothetical protein NC826_06075 [Candidatus Omnitrophica bacterium]|nr:hypothetical protein [Candidatus Omnitrophota bacterium]